MKGRAKSGLKHWTETDRTGLLSLRKGRGPLLYWWGRVKWTAQGRGELEGDTKVPRELAEALLENKQPPEAGSPAVPRAGRRQEGQEGWPRQPGGAKEEVRE